jgi:hypothetical protein
LALSTTDAWAVGYSFGASGFRTLTEHWDGSGWVVVTSPAPGASSYLTSITRVPGSTTLWASGYYLTKDEGFATLVERWNGSIWKVVTSTNPASGNALYGIAASTASSVITVGLQQVSGGLHPGVQTLAEHWNGTAWTTTTGPTLPGPGRLLAAAVDSSSGSGWAVGRYYDADDNRLPLIEHWDGSAWSLMASPHPSGRNVLEGVAVIPRSGGAVWAVGEQFGASLTANALIEVWDGSAWQLVPSGSPGGSDSRLSGVAATASRSWTVGFSADGAHNEHTLIERC